MILRKVEKNQDFVELILKLFIVLEQLPLTLTESIEVMIVL